MEELFPFLLVMEMMSLSQSQTFITILQLLLEEFISHPVLQAYLFDLNLDLFSCFFFFVNPLLSRLLLIIVPLRIMLLILLE